MTCCGSLSIKGFVSPGSHNHQVGVDGSVLANQHMMMIPDNEYKIHKVGFSVSAVYTCVLYIVAINDTEIFYTIDTQNYIGYCTLYICQHNVHCSYTVDPQYNTIYTGSYV